MDASPTASNKSFQFDLDTAVSSTGNGVYDATISDRWRALGGVVNGGYTLALSVGAIGKIVAHPDPLVVSGSFLRPASAGPAQIRTRVIRIGRRHSTAEAALVQDDKEILRTVATFANARGEGRTAMFGAAPELSSPDECVDPMALVELPELTLADRVEYRLRSLPGWISGEPTNQPTNEFWMRFKDGRPADPLALVFLVDAAAPAILEIGEPTSTTVELTIHVRARPAAGWLACKHQTRFVAGGYHEEDFEIWDSDGRLVAQARQLAVLP